MSLSCTVSKILSLIFQSLKRSRNPEHIPFGGNLLIHHSCTCTPPYQSTHKQCLVSPTPKMILLKNGSRDPDHAHCGLVCHPKTSIWYISPPYKIWQLSLQPFRRYDCGHRNWKWVMWRNPDHAPQLGGFVIRRLGFGALYLCAKLSRFRDIVGVPKFTVGHVTLIKPF